MANQLESALVIALRDVIRWESAVATPVPDINAAAPFNTPDYQARDRALAYKDLLVGAAIVEASVQVSDVYNYSTIKPRLEGPVPNTYSFTGTKAGNLTSQVRHVLNSSIPLDAARYADADLYGRDALAYEVLARACQVAFLDSPVPRIDASGTVIADTAVWSLAEGQDQPVDANTALALNRDFFKLPDQNLADRDNQLAGYVAQLAQVLKNPFEHALRLYVQTVTSGQVDREPDIYALISDDGVSRVFQAEPAITDGNQIVYNVAAKTLQWIRENVDEVHIPQIYALAVPGIDTGQVVQTLPTVPNKQDAQFWRTKAGQIAPAGATVSDEASVQYTATSDVSGGYVQMTCASLPVPGQLSINLPGLSIGPKRFNLLVKPCPTVEIAGQSNNTSTSGSNGGVDFPTNVSSGDIGTHVYAVDGGDGIVYNGITYLPGMSFAGVPGVTTFTQAGALTSSVRQTVVSWQLALPPGAWSLQFDYADLLGTSTGFGVRIQYTAAGASPVDIGADMATLPTGSAGQLLTSPAYAFDVASAAPFTLRFLWTYGGGQLHVRRIAISSTNSITGQFAISGSYQGTTTNALWTGQAYQAEVVRLPGYASGTAANQLIITSGTFADLPLQVLQVDVQSTGSTAASAVTEAFQGWRQECLDRAERVIQQGYVQAVAAYGSNVPTFRDSGSAWSVAASENWMSFAEVGNPRLRQMTAVSSICVGRQYVATSTPTVYNGTMYSVGESFYGVDGVASFSGQADQIGAFMKSSPGHAGQPCLVPTGLYFDQSGTGCVRAWFDTPLSLPVLATCQPWMIEYGLYVAQSEFWMPEML